MISRSLPGQLPALAKKKAAEMEATGHIHRVLLMKNAVQVSLTLALEERVRLSFPPLISMQLQGVFYVDERDIIPAGFLLTS